MKIDAPNALALLTDKFVAWYELIITSIPNIVVAIIVFFAFLLIARFVRKIVGNIFQRFTKSIVVNNLVKNLFHTLTIIVGLFITLELLNLEKTVTSILAGAGVIGLALGFAFQEIASNFVSGILIALREPYKLHDIVEIDGFFGKVSAITLRTTTITSFKGLDNIIPNKKMFTEPFTNYTSTPKLRIFLEVGVSYGDDLEMVERVTREAVQKVSGLKEDEEVEVFFTEFGSSSINLVTRFWIKYPEADAFYKCRHEAIMNIKKAFDANDIMIPFPIRTLDFGIKGGEKLSSMLGQSENA